MGFNNGFRINPFSTNVPLLYPLKTSENLDFFSGYESGTLVEKALNKYYNLNKYK